MISASSCPIKTALVQLSPEMRKKQEGSFFGYFHHRFRTQRVDISWPNWFQSIMTYVESSFHHEQKYFKSLEHCFCYYSEYSNTLGQPQCICLEYLQPGGFIHISWQTFCKLLLHTNSFYLCHFSCTGRMWHIRCALKPKRSARATI